MRHPIPSHPIPSLLENVTPTMPQTPTRPTRWPLSGPALALLLLVAGLAVAATGCKTSVADDPVLRLSSAEALSEGKALMEAEKYTRARKYLSQAFEVEPNSRAGREGLLLLADSYYLAGNNANWILAEAKYRDFLNRFPTSDQAAYAQYQIANSLAARVKKSNRDQSSTYKALQAYQELVRLYPTSDYAAEAEVKVQEVRDRLAEHEFVIGDFYLRYRYPAAAAGRFETLLERFPAYTERDKVLYHLGLAYARSRNYDLYAQAESTFDRLRGEYPGSEWVERIPDELPEPPRRLTVGEDQSEEAETATEAVEDAAREVIDPS